jgi:hypothetical protein
MITSDKSYDRLVCDACRSFLRLILQFFGYQKNILEAVEAGDKIDLLSVH